MSDKVKVNIYMPADLLAALKKLAHMKGVPYAELVRTAVRGFISENAGKIADERAAIARVNKP